MPGSDERMSPGGVHHLLSDVRVLRCTHCGVPIIEPAGTEPSWHPHRGCGGRFRLVPEPFARAVLLRLMSHRLLGRG